MDRTYKRCVNCGCPFTSFCKRLLSDIYKATPQMVLCALCHQEETKLIESEATNDLPDRLKHYEFFVNYKEPVHRDLSKED